MGIAGGRDCYHGGWDPAGKFCRDCGRGALSAYDLVYGDLMAREEAYEAMRAALTPGSSDHDWDGLVSWAKAAGYPFTQDEAGWRHIALKLAEKVLALDETRRRALALAEQADA